MLFNFVLLSMLFAVLGFLGFMLYKELSEENLLSEKSNIKIDKLTTWGQEYEFKDLNTPFKCICGITSRKYQFTGENHSNCPQCNKKIVRYTRYGDYANEIPDDRDFPFAPKLTVQKFLEIWNQKEEMERIQKELKELEEYDKEIEAWENIQLNKIKQYEEKANQIKKDLEKQHGQNNII